MRYITLHECLIPETKGLSQCIPQCKHPSTISYLWSRNNSMVFKREVCQYSVQVMLYGLNWGCIQASLKQIYLVLPQYQMQVSLANFSFSGMYDTISVYFSDASGKKGRRGSLLTNQNVPFKFLWIGWLRIISIALAQNWLPFSIQHRCLWGILQGKIWKRASIASNLLDDAEALIFSTKY